MTRLRIPIVPERWIIESEGVPLNKSFVMEAGEERLVTVKVEIRGDVRTADLHFVQELPQSRDNPVLGGFTVRVAEPRERKYKGSS